MSRKSPPCNRKFQNCKRKSKISKPPLPPTKTRLLPVSGESWKGSTKNKSISSTHNSRILRKKLRISKHRVQKIKPHPWPHSERNSKTNTKPKSLAFEAISILKCRISNVNTKQK